MAGLDYEKVSAADPTATAHRDGYHSDSGSDGEEYSQRTVQRDKISEDRRRYDQDTLGQDEEVETLLASGEKGSRRHKKGALRRLEQGGQESTSESSSLIDSSEDDWRRLGEVQHSSKQVSCAGSDGGMIARSSR